MNSIARTLAATFALFFVGACGSDSPTPDAVGASGGGAGSSAAGGGAGSSAAGGGAGTSSTASRGSGGGAAGTGGPSSGSGGESAATSASGQGGAAGRSSDPGAGGASGSGGSSTGPAGGRTGGGGATSGSGGASASAGGSGSGGATTGSSSKGGAGGGSSGTAGSGGGSTQLPAGVSAMFPAPGATNVCPDPPLRITFSSPPTLGTSGKIQVFNTAGTVVASVDMSASTITDTIGGTQFVLVRPVFVDGNDAVVYLKSKALAFGQTYYVTVDSGAIKPSGGGSFSLAGSTGWRFSTAAAAPSDLSAISVALDGSGDFCSVQRALDALPSNNTSASTITVDEGTYHEIVRVANKANITLKGKSRTGTQIVGTNNNTQEKANPNGASTSNRALMSFESTNGLVIDTLTIKNQTPQDGSQAEALRLNKCDKCIVRNSEIWSLQDTLLWDGRIYADNDLIVGNVDYVWGTGAAYFNQCELRSVGRSGYIVQARNAAGAYGYVFVDCKLTVDSSSKDNMLARIDVSEYPGSMVAYVNCQMSGVAAAGWTITGGSATSSLRFWEYQSKDASGSALNTSGRVGGTQISASQATSLRDPSVVLGGWSP